MSRIGYDDDLRSEYNLPIIPDLPPIRESGMPSGEIEYEGGVPVLNEYEKIEVVKEIPQYKRVVYVDSKVIQQIGDKREIMFEKGNYIKTAWKKGGRFCSPPEGESYRTFSKDDFEVLSQYYPVTKEKIGIKRKVEMERRLKRRWKKKLKVNLGISVSMYCHGQWIQVDLNLKVVEVTRNIDRFQRDEMTDIVNRLYHKEFVPRYERWIERISTPGADSCGGFEVDSYVDVGVEITWTFRDEVRYDVNFRQGSWRT